MRCFLIVTKFTNSLIIRSFLLVYGRISISTARGDSQAGSILLTTYGCYYQHHQFFNYPVLIDQICYVPPLTYLHNHLVLCGTHSSLGFGHSCTASQSWWRGLTHTFLSCSMGSVSVLQSPYFS